MFWLWKYSACFLFALWFFIIIFVYPPRVKSDSHLLYCVVIETSTSHESFVFSSLYLSISFTQRSRSKLLSAPPDSGYKYQPPPNFFCFFFFFLKHFLQCLPALLHVLLLPSLLPSQHSPNPFLLLLVF